MLLGQHLQICIKFILSYQNIIDNILLSILIQIISNTPWFELATSSFKYATICTLFLKNKQKNESVSKFLLTFSAKTLKIPEIISQNFAMGSAVPPSQQQSPNDTLHPYLRSKSKYINHIYEQNLKSKHHGLANSSSVLIPDVPIRTELDSDIGE